MITLHKSLRLRVAWNLHQKTEASVSDKVMWFLQKVGTRYRCVRQEGTSIICTPLFDTEEEALGFVRGERIEGVGEACPI
jgi:hypothetical protein